MKKIYIFANDKKDIFLSANCKETKNINLAITFKSIEEALNFEDKFCNDITFLNYLYILEDNKLSKIDV